MTAPILLLAVLLLVALLVGAYVLWPLLRRSPSAESTGPGAGAVSREVMRERRRELEASLAHLPPDAPERRAAVVEFAAQADAELGAAGAELDRATSARRRPWAAAALAVLLTVPTFALYWIAGAPEAASPEFRAAAREPESLDELVVDLRRRLERDPKALDGWRLLGRAELARGRLDDARQAFERAAELAPGDAQAKVDLADALAQSQGAVLEGRPIALIREALALDARNPKALALAGAYEVTQRNPQGAITYWRRLIEVLPADSEQSRQVAGFVADLEAGRAPQVGPRPTEGAPPPVADATRPPSVPGAPAPQPAAPDTSASALKGRVELERRLTDRLGAQDTVFVVVRTLDDAGTPIGPPVAVLRARGADLPLAFTLDDRLAMSPMARLSTVPPDRRVVVIARVSRSGEATARSGDLQGASTPVKPGASGLRILIDTVVD